LFDGADGNCNDGLDYPLRSCFLKTILLNIKQKPQRGFRNDNG